VTPLRNRRLFGTARPKEKLVGDAKAVNVHDYDHEHEHVNGYVEKCVHV
jgi:hypothetical protein